MSVEAITWALRQEVRQSSAKFVLVVLGNCASPDTGHAWPSIAYLATATSQDRKTVQANLQRLAEWGLIEDTGKRAGTTAKVVVWRVRCGPDLFSPAGREKRDHPENGMIPKSPTNGPEIPEKRSQKRDTETKGNVKEPSKRRPAAEPLPPLPDWLEHEAGQQAWADFADSRKAQRAPLTSRAAELVLKTLGELRDQGQDVVKVLEQSTKNRWRDVFPLKGSQPTYAPGQPTYSPRQPDAAQVLAAHRPRQVASEETARAALDTIRQDLRR